MSEIVCETLTHYFAHAWLRQRQVYKVVLHVLATALIDHDISDLEIQYMYVYMNTNP